MSLSYPGGIRITTTHESKHHLKASFCGGGWARFVEEYSVYAGMFFDKACLIATGKPENILSDDDGKVKMEAIFRMAQGASAGGEAHIPASIAGGRKAMSYFLFTIRMPFGGAFDGHYKRFRKARDDLRAFSVLLSELVRHTRKAVKEVSGTDYRVGVALVLNPDKWGSYLRPDNRRESDSYRIGLRGRYGND